jgi:hypothetical protein
MQLLNLWRGGGVPMVGLWLRRLSDMSQSRFTPLKNHHRPG